MPKPREAHQLYRLLLYLYPRAHREEYGDQMVQTLDDLMEGHKGKQSKLGLWVRVGRELPLNIIEEHINNLKGVNMGKLLSNKRVRIGGGVVILGVAAIVVSWVVSQNNQFAPTTLAKVRDKANPPICVQNEDNPKIVVDTQDEEYIGNAVASSIIDVPAGTKVDVYLQSYEGSKASGTASYSGDFGSFNFVAQKSSQKAADNYTGGWNITRFDSCRK